MLKIGNKTQFKKKISPSYNSPNAKSAYKYGKCITDTVSNWIKKEYVIGPFDNPPFKNFNSSPLMAAVQKTKVRPILNLSAPPEKSFNNAINKNSLRKLTMSTAKKFRQTLIRMGKNAKFAKSDLVDAYKLIPCHPSDWKFFGFKWLGKFLLTLHPLSVRWERQLGSMISAKLSQTSQQQFLKLQKLQSTDSSTMSRQQRPNFRTQWKHSRRTTKKFAKNLTSN